MANKLYPLSSISEKIEDFAKEMLLSIVTDDQIALTKEADGTNTELQKVTIESDCHINNRILLQISLVQVFECASFTIIEHKKIKDKC